MAHLGVTQDMKIHKACLFAIQKTIDISCNDIKLRYIEEFQRFVNKGLGVDVIIIN